MKLGFIQEKHIRCRLRTVAKFCLQYHDHCGNNDYYVKDILKPSNIKKIFNVAKVAYGTALSPATRLGPYLKELILVLKHNAIFTNDKDGREMLDNLHCLIEAEWSLISAPKIRTLKAGNRTCEKKKSTLQIRQQTHDVP